MPVQKVASAARKMAARPHSASVPMRPSSCPRTEVQVRSGSTLSPEAENLLPSAHLAFLPGPDGGGGIG